MDSEGYKHIVVFSANGGIGADTLKTIAGQVLVSDEKIKIHLLARKSDKAQNPPEGLVRELFEAYDDKPGFEKLQDAFALDNHRIYNANKINELASILKDADATIIATGEQRKAGQERDAPSVIETNLKAITPMMQAVARYAPLESPVVIVTNPLDIMVTKAQEVFDKELQANPREGTIPKIKVVGMAGILDESRLRILTAETINQAQAVKKGSAIIEEVNNTLRDSGIVLKPKMHEGKLQDEHAVSQLFSYNSFVTDQNGNHAPLSKYITQYQYQQIEEKLGVGNQPQLRPRDIQGNIFGEHGPSMVVDMNAYKVKGQAIKDYLSEQGFEDGETISIIKEAIAKTRSAGGDQIKKLGRSVQLSTAVRAVEMVNTILGETPKAISASILYDDASGERPVASGRPVILGNGKIEEGEWPETAKSQDAQDAIKAARAKIRDAIVRAEAVEAERHDALTQAVAGANGISHDDNQGHAIITWGQDTPGEHVAYSAKALQEHLGLPEDGVNVNVRGRSVRLNVGSEVPPPLLLAAQAAGQEISAGGRQVA